MITGEPVTKIALKYSEYNKHFSFSKFHLDMVQCGGKKWGKWNLSHFQKVSNGKKLNFFIFTGVHTRRAEPPNAKNQLSANFGNSKNMANKMGLHNQLLMDDNENHEVWFTFLVSFANGVQAMVTFQRRQREQVNEWEKGNGRKLSPGLEWAPCHPVHLS